MFPCTCFAVSDFSIRKCSCIDCEYLETVAERLHEAKRNQSRAETAHYIYDEALFIEFLWDCLLSDNNNDFADRRIEALQQTALRAAELSTAVRAVKHCQAVYSALASQDERFCTPYDFNALGLDLLAHKERLDQFSDNHPLDAHLSVLGLHLPENIHPLAASPPKRTRLNGQRSLRIERTVPTLEETRVALSAPPSLPPALVRTPSLLTYFRPQKPWAAGSKSKTLQFPYYRSRLKELCHAYRGDMENVQQLILQAGEEGWKDVITAFILRVGLPVPTRAEIQEQTRQRRGKKN